MPILWYTREVEEPLCSSCKHSALDHEGDGYGLDIQGSYDWFACFEPDCSCRVRGYITNMAYVPPKDLVLPRTTIV